MAWTTPRTWVADEVPGATDFNTHIRDNLNALKSPPFAQTAVTYTGNYTTTSTTFTTINSAFHLSFSTYGGAIQCHLQGVFTCGDVYSLNIGYSGSGSAWVSSLSDQEFGFGRVNGAAQERDSLDVFITGLPSGTYTFFPQWRVRQPTTAVTAHTSGVHMVFWARETS